MRRREREIDSKRVRKSSFTHARWYLRRQEHLATSRCLQVSCHHPRRALLEHQRQEALINQLSTCKRVPIVRLLSIRQGDDARFDERALPVPQNRNRGIIPEPWVVGVCNWKALFRLSHIGNNQILSLDSSPIHQHHLLTTNLNYMYLLTLEVSTWVGGTGNVAQEERHLSLMT